MKIIIRSLCFIIGGLVSLTTLAQDNQLAGEITTMKIKIIAPRQTLIFTLNHSQAAKDLYQQLPLQIEVKNYSTDEKIFYPPKKLNTHNTPKANAVVGTLAYYAPWGNVVIFYGDFGLASGLFELGKIESGAEHISQLSGTIKIEKYSE